MPYTTTRCIPARAAAACWLHHHGWQGPGRTGAQTCQCTLRLRPALLTRNKICQCAPRPCPERPRRTDGRAIQQQGRDPSGPALPDRWRLRFCSIMIAFQVRKQLLLQHWHGAGRSRASRKFRDAAGPRPGSVTVTVLRLLPRGQLESLIWNPYFRYMPGICLVYTTYM